MNDDLEKRRYWLGFDLGGTKMLAVVYDQNLQPIARKRKKTRGNEGAEAGLKRISGTVEKALQDAEISADQLCGIGIGAPGPVDPVAGVIIEAPNLGWQDIKLGQFLAEAFECPVRVINDVDAGVYGEYCMGAARSSRCAVGIFPGTGVGGGCVYEDNILHGRDITCMEIGHTRISGGSRTSGYHLPGTLESEASRLAIAAEAAKAAYRGDAPHLAKIAGTDITEIRSGAIAEAIHEGDTAITTIVVRAAETIGLAVVNIVHLLAADTVVLGGGLVEALPDLIIGTVARTARNNVLPAYRDRFHVCAAQLGDDAGAVGAAAWARKQIAGVSAHSAVTR